MEAYMSNIDELMEALNKAIKEKETGKKEPTRLDGCSRFVKQFDLRKGLTRTPNYVIFAKYMTEYKLAPSEERLSKVHFFRLLGKHFDRARVGKRRYYLTEEGQFDLSRENMIESKNHDENYDKEIAYKTGRLRKKRVYTKRKQARENKKKSE